MKQRIKYIASTVTFALVVASVYSQDNVMETRLGNYSLTTDLEAGWRWRGLDGSVDKFRSDINLHAGPRLLGLNVESSSLNHLGLLYDKIYINSSGWGGDPNAWTRLRVEKNKLYRFSTTYRRFDYYNFLPTFALFEHNFDVTRRNSDFSLTLFPESPLKFILGYGRNSSYGPSFTTLRFAISNEYPLAEPLRRTNDDYRLGADWKLYRTVISYEQSFRALKNDRHIFQNVPVNPGNSPSINSFLLKFDSLQPIRVFIPVERLTVRSKLFKNFDFTGRFVYSRARTTLTGVESIRAVDVPRTRIDRTVLTDGISTKPNALIDSGLTYRANKKLSISDTFRFNRYGINGTTLETTNEARLDPNGIQSVEFESVFNRFLGVKSHSNFLNAEYDLNPHVAFRIGYRFTHRTIDERKTEIGDRRRVTSVTTNQNAHVGIIGFNFRLARMLTVFGDYEQGTSDRVFTRVSPSHVKNWRLRAQYRPVSKLFLSGSFVKRDNNVPVPLATNQFRNTGYSISASWVPRERFAFNIGYNRVDIDSKANIVFFLAGRLNEGRSFYFSNTNLMTVDAHFGMTKRLDLYLGYRLLKDLGVNSSPSIANDFINSLPLSFLQPSAKISYKLSNRFRWNIGYDYYSYHEKQLALQNYRAHIAYSSINFAF